MSKAFNFDAAAKKALESDFARNQKISSSKPLPKHSLCFQAKLFSVHACSGSGGKNSICKVVIGSMNNVTKIDGTWAAEPHYWLDETTEDPGSMLHIVPIIKRPKSGASATPGAEPIRTLTQQEVKAVTLHKGAPLNIFSPTVPTNFADGASVMLINVVVKVGAKKPPKKAQDGNDIVYATHIGGASLDEMPGCDLSFECNEIRLVSSSDGTVDAAYLSVIGAIEGGTSGFESRESIERSTTFAFPFMRKEEYPKELERAYSSENKIIVWTTLTEKRNGDAMDLGPYKCTTKAGSARACWKLTTVAKQPDPAVPAKDDANPSFIMAINQERYLFKHVIRTTCYSDTIEKAFGVVGEELWSAFADVLTSGTNVPVVIFSEAGATSAYTPESDGSIAKTAYGKVHADLYATISKVALPVTPNTALALIGKTLPSGIETDKDSGAVHIMDDEAEYVSRRTSGDFFADVSKAPIVCISSVGVKCMPSGNADMKNVTYKPQRDLIEVHKTELKKFVLDGYHLFALVSSIAPDSVSQIIDVTSAQKKKGPKGAQRYDPINLKHALDMSRAFVFGGDAFQNKIDDDYGGVYIKDRKLPTFPITAKFDIDKDVVCIFAVRPDIANAMYTSHGEKPTALVMNPNIKELKDIKIFSDGWLYNVETGQPLTDVEYAAIKSDAGSCAPAAVPAGVKQQHDSATDMVVDVHHQDSDQPHTSDSSASQPVANGVSVAPSTAAHTTTDAPDSQPPQASSHVEERRHKRREADETSSSEKQSKRPRKSEKTSDA